MLNLQPIIKLDIDIQLEMIVLHTCTTDDVNQLADKIGLLKFQASRRPSSKIGSEFSNLASSKHLKKSSLRTSNDAEGGGNNQEG